MKNSYSRLMPLQAGAVITLVLLTQVVSAQTNFLTTQFTNITPSGCSNNYSTGCAMNSSAGGTYIMTTSANGSGDNFFRFKNTGGTDREPPTNGDVISTNQATPHTNIQNGTSNAFKITGANTSYRYIFKVDASISNIAIFEIQGTNIRSISSASRSPSGTIYPGQNVTVIATLDGAFDTGQAAYLRYTTDGFTSSTIVKMTGSGTSYTANIPASANVAGNTIDYYLFTSGDVSSITATNADLYTINLNNNGGSNYSYTIASTWESTMTGDWHTASTWLGGSVPEDDQPVTIRNGHNVTIDGDINTSTITIDAGATLTADDGSTRNINIDAGGAITVNGDFKSNNEIINCEGNCTFSGTLSINDITTLGGITFGANATVQGTLTLNSGGFTFDAPTYSSSSTLLYNTGGTFNRNAEWTSTSGVGYPAHVQISNNTTLNLANGSNTARQISGNLTIDNGSSLSMEAMTGSLTVLGNVTNNGSLTLSSASGGDLLLTGHWTKGSSATFTPNNRAVTFNGSSTQAVSVTGGGTEDFDYLIVDNSAANLLISGSPATNIDVNAATSNPLQLLNGGINLNGQTMTLTGSGGNILVDGDARTITGSTNSILKVTCATSTTCKSVSSTNGGSLVMDTNTTLELETGGINFGSGLSTINGTFEIKNAAFVDTNSPTYGNASLLKYNTGGNFDRRIEWNDASLNDVTIVAGTTLIFGNEAPTDNRSLGGDLTIEGTLDMNGTSTNMSDSLTVGGNCTVSVGGTLTLSNTVGGDLKLKGDFTNNGTFSCNERAVFFEGNAAQQASGTSAITIDYLHMTNSGAGLTLQRVVNVDNELHMTNGIITTTSSNLLIVLENGIMGSGAEGSNSSYVNGPMVKKTNSTTAFTFPTGKNSILAQIGISPQATGATDFTAEYFNSNPDPTYDKTSLDGTIHHVSEIEYWQLDRSTGGTPSDATVTLHWNSHSDVSGTNSDHNALLVARWNGSQWNNEGGNSIVTGVPGQVTSNIITSFSPFTLATTIEANTLPVELLSFKAKKMENNDIQLLWETIQEKNNDYFVVERSKDGEFFSDIGTTPSQGNSNSLQTYELIDQEPYHGINYYRLRDVAFDGSIAYSQIVSVFIEGDNGLDITIFPNPSTGDAEIEVWTEIAGLHQIKIYDMTGKEVYLQQLVLGNQLWEGKIKLPFLAQGAYVVTVSNAKKTRSRRFIKL